MPNKDFVRRVLPLLSLMLFLVLIAPARADYTAVVDPSLQYQTWQGWGTSLAWWAKVVGGFPEPARSDYMTKAFDPVKGLGLNIVRYNIGGGENPQYLAPNKQYLQFRTIIPGYEPAPGVWDWTADADQRWVLQQAIKMGVTQVEAFSNSPPYWMTVSGSVTGNHGGKDNIKPDEDTAFGEYLATVVKHFHDAWGITFRDVEPINEPSGGWWGFGNWQEGCHVDRPHQNALVNATGAALARLGVTYTTVAASDENTIGDADKSFGYYDATALKYLSKVNTHSYGGGDRTQLFDFANAAGKDLWMSEDGDGDASGMNMSRHILDDVNGMHATSWVTWQVVDAAGGWGFLRSPQSDETTTAYTINKKYYVMAQYSKFIRPDYKVISGGDANSLAAYDARTHTLIIVTTNGGGSDTTTTYDLSRFTRLGSTVTAYRTSPTEDFVRLPAVTLSGKGFKSALPAKSVTTFVIAGADYTGLIGINYRRFWKLINVGNGQDLGGADQQWDLVGMGDGDYKIVNRKSGLVLDVNQSSTLPGAGVIQFDDNGGDNQLWHLERVGEGLLKLINRHSGLALAVGLVQQADDGSANQHWRLVAAPAG